MNVLFLGFCFFCGFSESMLAVCCLFYQPAQLVCSLGMLAGVGGCRKGWPEGNGRWSMAVLRATLRIGSRDIERVRRSIGSLPCLLARVASC